MDGEWKGYPSGGTGSAVLAGDGEDFWKSRVDAGSCGISTNFKTEERGASFFDGQIAGKSEQFRSVL